jgi:hypothetical protein
LHPAALLLTQAMILLKAEVTLPWFAITAIFKVIKERAISGLICIVNTEFGQNPRVSLKNSANLLTSGLESGESGFTNGIYNSSLKVKSIIKQNPIGVSFIGF